MFAGLGALVGGKSQTATADSLCLPLLRLTVLGSEDSGKTSLISSWVNNTCPTAYLPTEGATLHYRTMRLENPAAGENDQDKLINVLVEIEDTYAWARSGGTDPYGQPYDAKKFLDVTPLRAVPKLHLPGISKPANAMAEHLAPSRTQYNPMARARMGFLIVFDANRRESLEAAQDIYFQLSRSNLNKHSVFLVANKIDKDPFNSELREVVAEARNYAKHKPLHVAEVSAIEFTRVRKLFRDVVEEIIMQPHLWSEDGEGLKALRPPKSSGGMTGMGGGNPEDCSVQ